MDPKDLDKQIKQLETQPSEALDGRIAALLDSAPTTTTGTHKTAAAIRTVRWAVAALILQAVIIAVPFFNGDKSDLWAQALENVRKIGDYAVTCTWTETRVDEHGTETVTQRTQRSRLSAKYGSYSEMYVNGELQDMRYAVLESNEFVQIFPHVRAYIRRPYEPATERFDPKDMTVGLLTDKFEQLGEKTIDGRVLTGIRDRRRNRKRIDGREDQIEMWFDRETMLPAFAEYSFKYRGPGVTQMTRREEYRYDVDFAKDLFEPNIPADYVPTIVSGLRLYTELTGGKYPWSIHSGVMEEAGPPPEDQMVVMPNGRRGYEAFLRAEDFYRLVEQEGRDFAYFGDGMTTADRDRILLYWRWRGPHQDYHVVWGDLHTGSLTPAQLSEWARTTGDTTVLINLLEKTDSAEAILLANYLGQTGDVSTIPDLLHQADQSQDPATRAALLAAVTTIRRKQEQSQPYSCLIIGRVVYPYGRPLPSAMVEIDYKRTFADREGYFVMTMPNVEPNRYRLGYAHQPPREHGGVFFWRPADNQKTWEIIVDWPSTLRGRIVDQNGQPQENIYVRLYAHPNKDSETIWPLKYRDQTDADGAFVLEKVPFGTPMTLVIADPDNTERRLTVPVDVIPDRECDLGTITLPRKTQ